MYKCKQKYNVNKYNTKIYNKLFVVIFKIEYNSKLITFANILICIEIHDLIIII